MKQFEAAEKVTQQMTKDGAIEHHHVTGETAHISQRDLELNLTPEDLANPELRRPIYRLRKAAEELDVAKARVPKKKTVRLERTYDPTTGKSQTRLHFEETDRVRNRNFHHTPLINPTQQLRRTLHQEVSKSEQENVGVEAGHRAEEAMESAGYFVRRHMTTALRQHRMKPWRELAEAERAFAEAQGEFLYAKTLQGNPSLQSSNPISKRIQKLRIQRSYATAIRRGETTATGVRGVVERTRKFLQTGAVSVRSNAYGVMVFAGLLACVFLLFAGVTSCSMMGISGISGLLNNSYLSEDTDLLAAEAAYCAMETELQAMLNNYTNLHPGYDEYRFDLDEIQHDPYVLLSILSALHDGAFTAEEVTNDLTMLLGQQYILTEATYSETRYHTETKTDIRPKRDPVTGAYVFEGGVLQWEEYEYEEEVPYTYYIRTVQLVNFNLSHVPVYIMDEETLGKYAGFMSTLGNREDLFPESEYVEKYTTPPNVYDIPESALQNETFATLIAEAEQYIGYPYVWGGYNPTTSFDCAGFVSWVLTNSGTCNTGRMGTDALFDVCTPVSAANARPGDLIFFTGTYDTPGISHVGIYVGGGQMLHCGDPIQYADINTDYWRSHFYVFGRPPYQS